MAMDRLGESGAALVIVACGLTGAALYAGLARRLHAVDAAAEAADGPATAELMAGDAPPTAPPVA